MNQHPAAKRRAYRQGLQGQAVFLSDVEALEWEYPYGSEEPYIKVSNLHKLATATPWVACRNCGEELRFIDAAWIDAETHTVCASGRKHKPEERKSR